MIVRTVFQPEEDLEVTEADAEVLRLQGLLKVPDAAAEPEPAPERSDAAPVKGDPGPQPTTLPPGQPVAAAPSAKTDPPAAASAPTDEAPPTEKG